jgi:TonB family protein
MFSTRSSSRSRNVAIAASMAWHAAIGLSLLCVMRGAPAREITATPRAALVLPAIVWLDRAGLDDGGGSGGREGKSAAKQVRQAGTDRLTVPVAKPPDPLAATPAPEIPAPEIGLQIPAMSMASALDSMPGTIQPQPGPPASDLGSGSRGGAGGRQGTGDGAGQGGGLGDGGPRGQGRGVYGLGGGVTPPVPLYRGTPRYTAEAAQARVQGSVLVECIVQPTGRCTDFRIVRSIQPPFGLDREAVVAAGEWRFKPGTIRGEQVPVLVTIEVSFTIR